MYAIHSKDYVHGSHFDMFYCSEINVRDWCWSYTDIGSDNGLSPGRRQAIIWTNDGLLLDGPLGTNFSEISIEIYFHSGKCISKCRLENGGILSLPHSVGNSHRSASPRPTTLEEDQQLFVDFIKFYFHDLRFKAWGPATFLTEFQTLLAQCVKRFCQVFSLLTWDP